MKTTKYDEAFREVFEHLPLPAKIATMKQLQEFMKVLDDSADKLKTKVACSYVDVKCSFTDTKQIKFTIAVKELRGRILTILKEYAILIPLCKSTTSLKNHKREDKKYMLIQNVKGLCVYLATHGYLQRNEDDSITIPIFWVKTFWHTTPPTEAKWLKTLLQEGSFTLVKNGPSKRAYDKNSLTVKNLPLTCLRADTTVYKPVSDYLDGILARHKKGLPYTGKTYGKYDPLYEEYSVVSHTVLLTEAGKRAMDTTPDIYKKCLVCRYNDNQDPKNVRCTKGKKNMTWSGRCELFKMSKIFVNEK